MLSVQVPLTLNYIFLCRNNYTRVYRNECNLVGVPVRLKKKTTVQTVRNERVDRFNITVVTLRHVDIEIQGLTYGVFIDNFL